jgi:hypothetical protein
MEQHRLHRMEIGETINNVLKIRIMNDLRIEVRSFILNKMFYSFYDEMLREIWRKVSDPINIIVNSNE